jgi:uncharacterized membrane protein
MSEETVAPARSRALTIAILIGLAARVALVATSIGTNDVPFMLLWAKYARQFGIAHAYSRQWELNHPPLSLLIIHWTDLTAQRLGIEFTDLLRLLQVAADLCTTLALAAIARIRSVVPDAALLFILSPAAIAISGFHCNTDPTMIALLVVSLLLLLRGHGFAAGLVFAASVGIKIIPLLVLPVMLVMARELRIRLAAACAIGVAAIFAPVVAIGGPAVLRNVFGYSGFAGKWGLPALMLTIEGWIARPRTTVLFHFALWYAQNGKYLVVIAIAALSLALWRRRDAPIGAIATVMLLVLALAPGFGIQYLVWPLPLLPYAVGRRMLVAVYGAIAIYVPMTYTIWSQGFPWWYADSIAPVPGKSLVTAAGLIVWIVIAAGMVDGVRRLLRTAT